MNALVDNDFLKSTAKKHQLATFAVFSFLESSSKLKKQSEHLANWQHDGFAGEMNYMLRDKSLFADLQGFLPSVQSVVSFVVPYANFENTLSSLEPKDGYGRVARYAWGRDYHKVLKKKVLAFLEDISKKLPTSFKLEYRVFTDAVPLLERALAASSALGFIGKNSLLITPGLGSFNFIIELLWNLDLDYKPEKKVKPNILTDKAGDGCKECSRCLQSCPTDALISPGVLDARECISYLTIEKKTEFSESEMQKISDWIFGCDICQNVCPFNHQNIPQTEIAEFSPEKGAGGFLKLEDILNISNPETFLKMFSGTAVMRAGRDNLLRNAISIVANSKYLPLVGKLDNLAENDSSSLVRNQAKKALKMLSSVAAGKDLVVCKKYL